ncbi:tRNA lysidine(34) synthetase TilS [Alloscardovia criceti]|uniref:tRNA lysidine(34) synthetase TilS n=1 Tax=Alloscardovia criceti TaxID=356828 RepID=UPI00037819C9|nr:tRNA lysidine(34) synthetase TilS [Alloscardovia criceti]
MAYSSLILRAQQEVRSCLATHGVAEDEQILVACSGGRDSLALAAVARRAVPNPVGALIVNHQLQAGSDEVARKTAQICTARGLAPVSTLDITVPNSRLGVEAEARTARYAALARKAREVGARIVLVAHTMDDSAETIAMRLMRAPSIEALTGIREKLTLDNILFLRPFLSLRREDTTHICKELQLDYWDDPTNGEDIEGLLGADFPLRSQFRHDVFPLLDQVTGRDVVRVLAQAAQRSREDLDIIEDAVEAAYERIIREKNGILEIKIRALKAFLPAIQRRVIAQCLQNVNIVPENTIIEELLQLSCVQQKKKSIRLSSALGANKVYDVIQLWKDSDYANL